MSPCRDYLQGFHFARPEPAVRALSSGAEHARETWRALVEARISSPRVLLVEDDAVSRALVRISLVDSGFDIADAATAVEGLALARSLRPDCVLIDLGLPDLDGLEVVRQLRADPELATTAVVVVTGAAYRDVKAKAFAAGADDYLVKPVVPDQLPSRLHGAIAVARAVASRAALG